MTVYRTAQGKMIDMTALAAKNQKTRAVGNMKVNARGDTIDSFGRVVQPVTDKVATSYSKTVGNRSANPVKQPPSKAKADTTPTLKEELSEYELEVLKELEDDEKDLEVIKEKEKGKE